MRTLILYFFGVMAIASFMNQAIIHHKVTIKCNICGKDMVIDSQLAGNGIHAHMACAMEIAGTANGKVYQWAKEKRDEQ